MAKRLRVKVPTVLQMEAVECGAASLAMVMGYYGKYVPLEEVRSACGVSRDGSKASNILKAAQRYGFDAKGYRKDISALKSTSLPFVAHWEFSHFLVVEGFGKGIVYLNDPGSGHRTVTEAEFLEAYTGIILSFKPSETFRKGGVKPLFIDSLKKRLQMAKGAFTYIALLGLALVLPGLAIPVFSRVFVDDILLQGRTTWVIPLLFGMGLTAFLRSGLIWLQQHYLSKMESKIAIVTSARFIWKILHLPAEFFTYRSTGDITYRMQSNDRIAKLLSGKLIAVVLNLFSIVFYFILMLKYHVVLSLLGLLIASSNIVYLKYVSNHRVDQNNRLLKERGLLVGAGINGLHIIETLKATGSESEFFAKWSGYQARVMNSEQSIGISSYGLMAFSALLTGLNNAIILSLGAYFVLNEQMTIGMLVAFQSLMTSFITPINELVGFGSELQEIEGEMLRLDDVMNYHTEETLEPKIDESIDPSDKLKGFLELRQVSFGYSLLEPPLIQDFNLRLTPGKRVALVGASGSGKSTVAKLTSGVLEPWSGEILFDERPCSSWPRSVLAGSLAVADQELCMFEGTVRENITLWDDMISEAQLINAAKDACIHEDITARSEGYESWIEEEGRNFSGGQRQRIEIARALIQNPSILIMDEATSALDPLTEKRVDGNIRRRGCTSLIVAHRLSTIRDCDEIIVLDKGKIVERGTHQELMEKSGAYAGLIRTE